MNDELKTLENLRVTEAILRRVAAGDISDEARPKNGAAPYNQTKYYHDCNTPACALGWYLYSAGKLPKDIGWLAKDLVKEEFPALQNWEIYNLFSDTGCDNAGEDAEAAADYIARFIANRFPEGAPSDE